MFPAHPFPTGNRSGDSQKLTEKVLTPTGHFLAANQRGKATPGMSLGDGQVSQINHGGGKVTVQCHFGYHLALLGFR